MSAIKLENLTKEFAGGRVVAVDNLSVTFPQGTTTCLLGPSGCGKTTLMRIISGLESPTRGEIYFGDQKVTKLSARKRNIAMVFQYPVIYRGINVRENIELPLKEERLSKAERDKRIDEVLDLLEMRESAQLGINQLDNATRQKVAVARAVARQTNIILFDEPITNVDINAKLKLKHALKELFIRLNQTIIYVTHDQTEAMTLADRIALMKDGQIMQFAPPRELYSQPDDPFGGWFLGNPGMNFFEGLLISAADPQQLRLPIFPHPARLENVNTAWQATTVGIRPEDVLITNASQPEAIACEVVDKGIVTGGQYVVTLQLDQLTFKAKAPADVGRRLNGRAWVQFPTDKIRLFGPDGALPAATIQVTPEIENV